MVVLPGNARSPEIGYACIVPIQPVAGKPERGAYGVLWRLNQEIEETVISDIRDGRAILLFDHSNEGTAYLPHVFERIYSWIEERVLPAGRVIWLDQNRYKAAAARKHVGMRADLVRFENHDYFVRRVAWQFSPFAGERLLGGDVDAVVERLLDPSRRDRVLLCMNATPRLHRALTVAALLHHGLLDKSLVSFPGWSYSKQGVSFESVTHFVDANPTLQYLRPALEVVRGMKDLYVDMFEEKGNQLTFKIDLAPYERTFFSIVTESQFTDEAIDRVTEKTTKAFCLGHPSIIVGSPNSVRFMTELGLRDWDGVLDRSVDTIVAPPERFQALMQEVLRQAAWIASDRAAWLAATREVSEFNIRHAMSGAMFEAYVAKYDRPLLARLKGLVGM